MHLAQCEHTRLFLSETGVQSYLYTYCVGLFGVCIMRCILHTKRSTVWCTSRSAHALSSPPVGDGLFSHIYIYTYIYICKYMYTYIYIHIYNMHVSFNMNIRRRVLFSKHCLAWCSPPIASSCWRRVSSHIYIYIYIYILYVYFSVCIMFCVLHTKHLIVWCMSHSANAHISTSRRTGRGILEVDVVQQSGLLASSDECMNESRLTHAWVVSHIVVFHIHGESKGLFCVFTGLVCLYTGLFSESRLTHA